MAPPLNKQVANFTTILLAIAGFSTVGIVLSYALSQLAPDLHMNWAWLIGPAFGFMCVYWFWTNLRVLRFSTLFKVRKDALGIAAFACALAFMFSHYIGVSGAVQYDSGAIRTGRFEWVVLTSIIALLFWYLMVAATRGTWSSSGDWS